MITDAQVHVWEADRPDRLWPPGGAARTQREVPFGADEVLAAMDRAGVDRAVLVPPSWEGDRNDVALAAAAAHPSRFAVMGRVDLSNASRDVLDGWREQPGMLGVRLTFHIDHAPEQAEWLFDAAERDGLPVMVFGPGRTAEFGAVARRHRHLRMIIDHCNIGTTASPGDLAGIVEDLMPLAECANVAVKLSALPCVTLERYPFAMVGPLVRRIVDAFGADRCMWGSDLSRLPCPYEEWVRAAREGFGVLDEPERAAVAGSSIATWLEWPEPAS